MHMQKEETTGDHQEFDEMYRRTQAEIYKFIRYRVADKELAKDVLQETYYVAYKKWDILCEHSNPMGWLINTAKNKIRELNKSLKKIEYSSAWMPTNIHSRKTVTENQNLIS